MNVYIFAIGGTGARVLRSLAFLLASGIQKIPDGTNFIPVIIDFDKTNGDKTRAIETLETYISVRKEAYNGVVPSPGERNFFLPDIKYLSEVAVAAGKTDVQLNPTFNFGMGITEKTSTGTFAEYMDMEHMMGNTYLTRALLESLYNNENSDSSFTELNLNLDKGFKGNPNIGSVIFENIKDDPEFKKFQNSFNVNTDRVFIISSIFGGTGSSGFPQIVNAIRDCGITGFETAPLGAAIVMPYFRVNTPAGGSINSNVFNSKQKAALSQYGTPDGNGKTLYSKITTSYFIGDDNPTTFPYSEGNESQMNDAHILELLAAASIVDFTISDPKTLSGNPLREYGLKTDIPDAQKITLADFADSEGVNWLNYLIRMALAFRFYKEYVLTGEISPREAFYSVNGMNLADCLSESWYQNLGKFVDGFDKWLGEMAHQQDGFKPFLQVETNGNDQEIQASDLYDYLNGYEGKKGGVFSKGAEFKDFAATCSSIFKKEKNNIENWKYLLLAMLYDAAEECQGYFKIQH